MNEHEHLFLYRLHLDCARKYSQFYADADARFQRGKDDYNSYQIRHNAFFSRSSPSFGVKSLGKYYNRHLK